MAMFVPWPVSSPAIVALSASPSWLSWCSSALCASKVTTPIWWRARSKRSTKIVAACCASANFAPSIEPERSSTSTASTGSGCTLHSIGVAVAVGTASVGVGELTAVLVAVGELTAVLVAVGELTAVLVAVGELTAVLIGVDVLLPFPPGVGEPGIGDRITIGVLVGVGELPPPFDPLVGVAVFGTLVGELAVLPAGVGELVPLFGVLVTSLPLPPGTGVGEDAAGAVVVLLPIRSFPPVCSVGLPAFVASCCCDVLSGTAVLAEAGASVAFAVSPVIKFENEGN